MMGVIEKARGRGRLFSKSLPLPLASPSPFKNTGEGDVFIDNVLLLESF